MAVQQNHVAQLCSVWLARCVGWQPEVLVVTTQSPLQSYTEEDEYLTIGALAKLGGVTVRTLRYYEEMDLIGPIKRSSGKYRLYNRFSLKRVNAILALQGLNFSLEEVLAVLGPYSKSRHYNKEEQIEQTRQSLLQQKGLIEEKIGQLTELSQDIENRLCLLETVCRPCREAHSEENCSETCSYLEVHN